MPTISWEWVSFFMGIFFTLFILGVIWLVPKVQLKKKEVEAKGG